MRIKNKNYNMVNESKYNIYKHIFPKFIFCEHCFSFMHFYKSIYMEEKLYLLQHMQAYLQFVFIL